MKAKELSSLIAGAPCLIRLARRVVLAILACGEEAFAQVEKLIRNYTSATIQSRARGNGVRKNGVRKDPHSILGYGFSVGVTRDSNW